MDTESTLDDYQTQLEQVELALQRDPNNDEFLKLKADLIEVINLTKELINEEKPQNRDKATASASSGGIEWNKGDKCMAIWRIDGRYYPATLDEILEDGTCTVIFDGYTTAEVSQVGQLMPHNKNANSINNTDANSLSSKTNSAVGFKKTFTKKELELKIREAKKRKKEKYALKIKAMEELSEKSKDKWKSFNTKLQSKTWQGVVKKNKYDLPDDHENKIGVGTNSATNRKMTPNGTILPGSSSAASAAAALNSSSMRHQVKRLKTTAPYK